MSDPSRRNLFKNEAEKTVVRAHKQVTRRLNQDWATIRTHSGIDNCKVDRTGWEIGVSRAERERRGPDILGRNRVSDIDQN